MDDSNRLRRAPLGFGTGVIDDKPVVLSARCTRAFLVQRVLVVGAAVPTDFSVDGRRVQLAFDGFGFVVAADVAAGTLFQLTLAPRVPRVRPRWWWKPWRLLRRLRAKRGYSAGAIGLVASRVAPVDGSEPS